MSRRGRRSATQKRRTGAGPQSRRPWLLGIGLVAVVGLVAFIAIALASDRPSVAEPATSPVVVSGEPLLAYSDGGADPAVGMTLPTLAGMGLDGEPLTIGPDGRAKAIVVVAHWCPHCQAEIPRLVAWLSENELPDGVDLVTVSTAIDPARPNYPPSAWLAREGWAQPTLIDDATYTAHQALGGMAFPGFVFVAAGGTVQLRTTGELDPATFGSILDQLGE